MSRKNIVAGLEIGRNRVSMVAGEARNGGFDFLAASKMRCIDGIKNGGIVNLDSATETIVKLLDEINQKIGKPVNGVFVNISGLNIRDEIASSVVTLPQRGCEITQRHIEDLIESCKIVSVPIDRYLLYFLPLEYNIDGQGGIKDPIGLYGTRLEAKIMVETVPFNQVQNIIKAVNFAGLEVEEVVLTALANAHSALSEEEKRQGVLLIDLKTDFTEISVFKEGSLLFFKTIPKGQESITNKVADKLGLPFELAEDLKIRYAFLDNTKNDPRNQDIIPIEWMGKRQNIVRGELNKIISEEMELIFTSILEQVKDSREFNNIVRGGGIILGGATYMEGILEWATQKLNFKIRQGVLRQEVAHHLEYDYVTSLGLLKFGLAKRQKAGIKQEAKFLKRIFQKTGEVLSDYF